MDCLKKIKAMRASILTLCLILGMIYIGSYPITAYADTAAEEYIKVNFSDISISGQGPIGISIVRSDEAKVKLEYLNIGHRENCAVDAKIANGRLQININYTAPDGVNVNFGTNPENVIRINIPNAAYTKFDITSNRMALQMQDFNAPIHITSNQAGVWLTDEEISRGTYNIDITSGPLYIEADTILKDITANVDNGPLSVQLNKVPTNLYVDTTNCGPVVNRPADWPAIYRTGTESPKLTLSNFGPATIRVADKKEQFTNQTKTSSSDKDWDEKDDWDWDWDEKDWEREEKALTDTYAAFGITKQGKSYYYEGKLVNIFMDRKPDSSFYRLERNSEGSINIKTIRNTDGTMTGVAYMTKAEVAALS